MEEKNVAPNQHDININRNKYEAGKRKVLDSTYISEQNKEDFEKFIRLKKVKENVGYGRLANLASYFYQFCTRYFPNKIIKDLEEDDYLDFSEKLDEGVFTTLKGERFSNEMILNYQRFFRSYMRTINGRAETENRFGLFHIKKKDYEPVSETLSYEDIKKVVESIPQEDIEIKFGIAFMFSTGCRSQDLRALRLKNFYFDRENDLKVILPALKTRGREFEIDLFRPLIEYYLFEHLQEEKGRDKNKYVFSKKGLVPITAQTFNRKLKEYTISSLGEEYSWISSHKLRHFSAVYYSQFSGMSSREFAYRFGWSQNSSAVSRYVDKVELGKTKIKHFMKNDEIQKYEAENSEFKEEISTLKKDFEMLKSMIKTKNLTKLSEEQDYEFSFFSRGKKVGKVKYEQFNKKFETEINKFMENNPSIKKDDDIIKELIETKVGYKQTKDSLKFTISQYDLREAHDKLTPWTKKFLGNNDFHKFKEIIFALITNTGVMNYRAEKLTEQEIELAQKS